MSTAVYKLPIKDTIVSAWHKVKGFKGIFFQGFALALLLQISSVFIPPMLSKLNAPSGLVGLCHFGILLVGYLIAAGTMYFGIRRAIDLPVKFNQLFVVFHWRIFLNFSGAYLLLVFLMVPSGILFFAYSVSTVLLLHMLFLMGFVVSCFAGVYFLIRLWPALFIILDKAMNLSDAFELSWKITRNNFWRLFALFIISQVLLLLGIISLGIGLIWVLPLISVFNGMQYQRLLANNQ